MDDNRVEVQVGAETAGIQAGMRDAAKAVKEGVSGIKESMHSVTEAFESISRGFAMVSTALAGGAAFREAVTSMVELTDEAKRLGKQMGVGTSEASRIGFAMKELGVNQDLAGMAAQRIAIQVSHGGEAFKKLGVATKDSNGNFRNSFDIMMDVNEKLKGFKEGTDRNIEGVKLYGRAWQALTPLLKASKEELKEKEKEAKELNLVISKENAEAVEEYKRSMESAKAVQEGVFKTIGEYVLPHLTEMAKWFRSIGPAAIEATRASMEAFYNVMDSVKAGALALWDGLVAVAKGIYNAILSVFGLNSQPITAMQFFKNLLKLVKVAFIGLRVGIETGSAYISTSIQIVVEQMRTLAEVAKAVWDSMLTGKSFSQVADRWREGMARLEKTVAEGKKKIVDAAMKGNADMQAALLGDLGKPKKATELKLDNSGKSSSGADLGDQGRAAIAKADAAAAAAIQKEALTEAQSVLDYYHKQFLISDKEYYDGKLAIAQAGLLVEEQKITAELVAVSKQSAKSEQERNSIRAQTIALEGQLTVVQMKRLGEEKKIRQEEAAAAEAKRIRVTTEAINTEKELSNIAIDGAEQTYQLLRDLDQINALQMLQIKRDLEEAKYQEDLKALERERENHKANVEEYQKYTDKIAILNAQHANKMMAANAAITKEEVKNWQTAMHSMEDAFQTMLSDIMQGTMTLQKIMQTLFRSLLKAFTNWIAAELMQTKTAEGIKTAIRAWGAGMRDAIFKKEALDEVKAKEGAAATIEGIDAGITSETIAANAAEAQSAAGLAGANGVASAAAIPLVGWELAPGAGAEDYAAAQGFASMAIAAKGYDIPAGVNPLTQLHEREMVLPKEQADAVRNMTDGGGGGRASSLECHGDGCPQLPGLVQVEQSRSRTGIAPDVPQLHADQDMSGENILKLPERHVREWGIFARIVGDCLAGRGHDAATIEHALEKLRPAFLHSYRDGIIVESDPEQAIRKVDIYIKDIVSNLLLNLAVLAIENYHLRCGDGSK